jgi:uroporphyrinogen-III decarboxylase
VSRHHYEAWAQTSAPVFISHDDMVWSQGAFMHPEIYRHIIFPRYRELWAPLKRAGKKVLFCSDANWTEFSDDIAAAGADGFIFEPMTSLEIVVRKYGRTHAIVSSKVDCRTLTLDSPAAIQAEIDASLELARACRGFMFAVGNHIPSNIPIANALFYMDYLRRHWQR